MKKLQYLKVLLICGIPILYYHFRYMIKFARHPEKYPFELRYKIARKEIRMVLKHFKVDYNLKNFDLFTKSKDKSLIICNHLSDADPLILIAASEKPVTFISKIETFKFPFVGKIAKALDVFPLDRKNIMNQISQIKNIVSYLKDPTKPSVIVYIEGTRNKNPENKCLDFHPGTLKIAQMANCPLIVTSTYGTFRVLDTKSYVKPYPCSISMIETLDKDVVKAANTTELAATLKDKIDNEVDNLRIYDKDYVFKTKISDKRKTLETRVDARIDS